MSSADENKAAVRACFAYGSRGEFNAQREVVTSDYILHPEDIRGADGLAAMCAQYRAALHGLTITIDHQFAEGDHVATRYTVSGTHRGDLMGIPATGREVSFSGLTVSRCVGGRIAEEWELTDVVSLLRQVGALPEPAHA